MTAARVLDYLAHILDAATKLLNTVPDLPVRFPEIPWRNMKGMRNRLAHGYFDINLETVWETLNRDLPALSKALPEVMAVYGKSDP